jgi:hypothetical protein
MGKRCAIVGCDFVWDIRGGLVEEYFLKSSKALRPYSCNISDGNPHPLTVH